MEGHYLSETAVQALLTDTDSLQKTAENLAEYINHLMQTDQVFLVRLDSQTHYKESGVWPMDGTVRIKEFEQTVKKWLPVLLESWCSGRKLPVEERERFLSEIGQSAGVDSSLRFFPICHEEKFLGFAVFGRKVSCGFWKEKELQTLKFLLVITAAAFSNRNLHEDYELQSWVYNNMMDRMQANVYITDVHTDQILFMNKTMKKVFGLEHPEGEKCWKILSKGKAERCSGCPVDMLVSSKEADAFCRWEEHNSVTGRFYDNYDSLMHWTDGQLAHFQYSVDITDSKILTKEATTDDLTGLLNRRGGKAKLCELMTRAREKGCRLTVGMYDVNSLKKVNDTFGHREGDNLLKSISGAVKTVLGRCDFVCRLSGDEFLVVFYDCGEEEAGKRILEAKKFLSELRVKEKVPYELSFSIGILEVPIDQGLGISEILHLADELMYEQKRYYHMQLGTGKQEEIQWKLLKAEAFDYDQQYLYDALVESTDDYLYVCDMATNTFRYSSNIVKEFGLPGEIIQNAADIWRTIVHPSDWDKFAESNRQISEGETEQHQVEYRALNAKGQWIKLRCRGHVAFNTAGEPRLFAGFIRNLGEWVPEWIE